MAWEHKESVADKKTLFDAFFDLEEQAALATQGLAISQRVEHRAGWDVKFAFVQEHWPPWITRIVADHPDQFNTEADAWALLRR